MAAPHPCGHAGAVVDDVSHPAARRGRHPVSGRTRPTVRVRPRAGPRKVRRPLQHLPATPDAEPAPTSGASAHRLPGPEGGGGVLGLTVPGTLWLARQARRFGGLARSITERLAGTASAPAQCRPGLRHRAARPCIYPQIAADKERAAVDSADGGRDLRLLTGNTWRLVRQGPGRAAADDLSHKRRARGVRGDPRPVPGVEYLRKPAQALGEMPASLRVEIHGDLAALERLPRPWPG